MQILNYFSGFSQSVTFLLLLLILCCTGASGFGSMGPISAAFGEDEFFCAIDASGKQDVICWGKNSSLTSPSPSSSSSSSDTGYFNGIPTMAALSGGEGFLCGILENTSLAYCWSLVTPGTIDCWEIVKASNNSLSSKQSALFYDQSISNLVLNKVVSGEGFSCGGTREGGLVCWGPNSSSLGVSNISEKFLVLASGRNSLCGISKISGFLKCWGNTNSSVTPPVAVQFVSLTAGANHFCGIRADNHGIECWGSVNSSSIPKATGFIAIASSDYTTCGIREDDLLVDCWFSNVSTTPVIDHPLELCSPGLCSAGSCGQGEFAFNASILNEPDLTSLCVRKDLKICSPCGSNCSEGFFLSSSCTANADRICTACSLCQNSSCWDICRVQSSAAMQEKLWHHLGRLLLIIGPCAFGLLLVILFSWCILSRVIATTKEEESRKQSKSCIGKPQHESDTHAGSHSPMSVAPCPGLAQVFRLSELKDATNGFKEFNELGRGSYGFVYKAVIADGQVVAVKRANAATIIHTNNRDFEMELEILCKIRHCNIVNLLGYCSEMGERLLVYEYMPHGTLYDHLHGGLSPLNWSLRLKISMQAAKGLEYLHKELVPPIVHRDVKSSNILLDSEWGARIADFGLITSNDKDLNADLEGDVYNFGIVLLEILSGRKSYDRDFTPPNIVEWAVPLIKQGKAAVLIDRYVALPRNVEPLLKLADIAELAVRVHPSERPNMTAIASWLEQIVKDVQIL
ncbi:Kinase family protein [Quillaja saponaria]|uniref:non-specific serine/threonine protein kinase n=1 Tax=Quillaja saponaria TaxID=32244 RepID=A0AAD7Q0F8_QUISA|nr:Kinase family protein [Quillaja saponaria]